MIAAQVPIDRDVLIAKIKEMQRTDGTAKDQWGAYCDQQGGGVRDPAKHEVIFLHNFVTSYNSGVRLESLEKSHLAELFKEGQRRSTNFKQAWANYCSMYGSNKHDPTKHDTSFLVGFLDFLGHRASMSFTVGGFMPPSGRKGAIPLMRSRLATLPRTAWCQR
eukprot:TRINITY_DN72127_c0_g1_i1.p1 TRINITY_DN72127_c0_g1~~TRINITY_DN72127_c0_g1_i1.p1  ORF type:complete len:163 (+),score=21.17 TRINITY_DN72127_c0_g1_i1:147-635(+)